MQRLGAADITNHGEDPRCGRGGILGVDEECRVSDLYCLLPRSPSLAGHGCQFFGSSVDLCFANLFFAVDVPSQGPRPTPPAPAIFLQSTGV